MRLSLSVTTVSDCLIHYHLNIPLSVGLIIKVQVKTKLRKESHSLIDRYSAFRPDTAEDL